MTRAEFKKYVEETLAKMGDENKKTLAKLYWDSSGAHIDTKYTVLKHAGLGKEAMDLIDITGSTDCLDLHNA